uniref:Uncharacterized protein n=1 Tax=Rhizophora mucronata TaxID=61149 RepID=A0A2P2QCT0_RHIMU
MIEFVTYANMQWTSLPEVLLNWFQKFDWI